MKIYLAAQFKEQLLMREWRKLLHSADHDVTSRWLGEYEVDEKSKIAANGWK